MKFICNSSAELVVRVATLSSRFGYVHAVVGKIPVGKNPQQIDDKLIAKYRITRDRVRALREHRAGMAKVKYLRWSDRFVLLATDGESSFFKEERPVNLRQESIRIGDYTVMVINGRPSVRLSAHRYQHLREQVIACAMSRKADSIMAIPRLNYQGVRQQQRQLAKILQRRRKRAGYRRGKRLGRN